MNEAKNQADRAEAAPHVRLTWAFMAGFWCWNDARVVISCVEWEYVVEITVLGVLEVVFRMPLYSGHAVVPHQGDGCDHVLRLM